MKDGLYIVDRGTIYGAFAVRDGAVVSCAPVLRKKLAWFKQIAKWYPTDLHTRPLQIPTSNSQKMIDVAPGDE